MGQELRYNLSGLLLRDLTSCAIKASVQGLKLYLKRPSGKDSFSRKLLAWGFLLAIRKKLLSVLWYTHLSNMAACFMEADEREFLESRAFAIHSHYIYWFSSCIRLHKLVQTKKNQFFSFCNSWWCTTLCKAHFLTKIR